MILNINTEKNADLSDDEMVAECMRRLAEAHPEVTGYTFIRTGPNKIQLMLWGNNIE